MKSKLFLILVLMLCLLAISPVLAQEVEVTPEATVAVVDDPVVTGPITVEDGGVVILNPAPAVDEAPAAPPAPVDPWAYFPALVAGGALVLTGLITAIALLKGKSTSALYQEDFPEIIKTPVRFGLELLINRAATTPEPNDDLELKRLAESLGYRLASTDGGRVVLISDNPTTPNLTVERVTPQR